MGGDAGMIPRIVGVQIYETDRAKLWGFRQRRLDLPLLADGRTTYWETRADVLHRIISEWEQIQVIKKRNQEANNEFK